MNARISAWDAGRYARDAAFVPQRGAAALRLLAPRPGERVLDIGCGDGALTQAIADAGAEVMGVDAAPSMVAAARARGLCVRKADMCALDFDATFDAAFSNAALHWAHDPPGALRSVARALRPGGRFVGECGGRGNVAAILSTLTALARRFGLDPRLAGGWFFPSPRTFKALARAAGFDKVRARIIHRPTPLDKGMRAWLGVFRADMLAAAGDDAQALLDEAVAALAPALRDEEGRWFADYVRLRFVATRG